LSQNQWHDDASSSAPAQTQLSYHDDDAAPSSFQRRDATRKARDTAASATSNVPADNRLESSEQPLNAVKRTSRRHARDVSYYYEDGERPLRDLLERLESRGKRQPIDRIDEPSEWRDRLRMQSSGRVLIERHPQRSLPVIVSDKGLSDGAAWISECSSGGDGRADNGESEGLSDGWYNGLSKRQPVDRIDEPSYWRDRYVHRPNDFNFPKRRTRSDP